jgi:hexosaminidase
MDQYRPPSSLYSFLPLIFIIQILIIGNGCRQNANSSLESASGAASGLLPVPQKQSFSGRDFQVSNNWIIGTANGLSTDDPSVQLLKSGIMEHAGLELNSKGVSSSGQHQLIRLNMIPGSVTIESVSDSSRSALEDQAYRLKLNDSEIDITANAPAGLFYGIQTLLQLLRSENGKILLPEGEITDWPDLELRIIYWDCAHHLDRMETFRRAIKQAAYFKINGFALKLEGHFQYKSAAPIVEPYAMTPAEYQELTDYAKAHFVELIPYLDAPAHVSFILKHPEYAGLRAFPNSNYEFSITNPGTDRLLSAMLDELIEASRGGKYILLSTDEAYYAGKSEGEKEAANAAGSNGKLLAGFIKRISDKLHEKGRTVIFWGEYPLIAGDISSLPAHLVNGVYNKDWAASFKQQGIRQLIYSSTQGVEPLFPNYFPLSDSSKGRVDGLLKTIYGCQAKGNPWITGTIVAAWGDSGLHPETFWLGYTTGCAATWNLNTSTARDLTDRFFNLFYGKETSDMNIVYQLLSEQADFWDKSWEWQKSKLRTPILGNSRGIYDTPRPAMDQSLPLLPVPSSKDLSLTSDWSAENLRRLGSAEALLKENDELLDLLQNSIRNAGNQKYNLEVLQSVALMCRHNLNLLLGLQQIDKHLKQSSDTASADPAAAVSHIDQALNLVRTILNERNETLASVTALWYRDWHPRVTEANGRTYLDKVDDIKDHLPVRTVDMSYLIYRELNYPLGKWAEEVRVARNHFASDNNLPVRIEIINWGSY